MADRIDEQDNSRNESAQAGTHSVYPLEPLLAREHALRGARATPFANALVPSYRQSTEYLEPQTVAF